MLNFLYMTLVWNVLESLFLFHNIILIDILPHWAVPSSGVKCPILLGGGAADAVFMLGPGPSGSTGILTGASSSASAPEVLVLPEGEVDQETIWNTMEDKKRIRSVEQQSERREAQIEKILHKRKTLHRSGQLPLNTRNPEEDITRGVKLFFSDLVLKFHENRARLSHLKRALSNVGNERSSLWKELKTLIEDD